MEKWLRRKLSNIDVNGSIERKLDYSNGCNDELYCFTLLLKKFKKNYNGVGLEMGSRFKYSECLSIFKSKLNRRLYGNNYKRKGKGIRVFIPFFESVVDSNQHFHIIISKEKGISNKVLESMIYDIWINGDLRWSRYNDGDGNRNLMMEDRRPFEIEDRDEKGNRKGSYKRLNKIKEERGFKHNDRIRFVKKKYDELESMEKKLTEKWLRERHPNEDEILKNDDDEWMEEFKKILDDMEDGVKKLEVSDKDYFNWDRWRLLRDFDNVSDKVMDNDELRKKVDRENKDNLEKIIKLGGKRILDLRIEKDKWKDSWDGRSNGEFYNKFVYGNFEGDEERYIGIDFQRFYYKENGYSFIDYGLKKFKVDKVDLRNLNLGLENNRESKIICKEWNDRLSRGKKVNGKIKLENEMTKRRERLEREWKRKLRFDGISC